LLKDFHLIFLKRKKNLFSPNFVATFSPTEKILKIFKFEIKKREIP